PYLTSGYCFMIANFYSHDRSNNRIFISVSLSGTLAHSLCMLKKKMRMGKYQIKYEPPKTSRDY
ncbi:hypothetical protein, partial [Yersinia pestis]